ncbi:DUF6141 family protein [candidate division KSB1 bacterium]
MDNSQIIFKESQKFDQWWLRTIILAGSALVWWAFYNQIILEKPWGSNPGPDWLVIALVLIIGIGLPLLFFSIQLITIITADSIRIRFLPFQFKGRIIPVNEIERFEIRQYRPIFEYGGWGIKYGKSGLAYNVKGKTGLQLYLKNDDKILIGTQKKDFLKMAMENVIR